MRRKETLIASAQAQGQSSEGAIATTEETVVQEQIAAIVESNGTEEKQAQDNNRNDLRMLKDFETSIEAGFGLATFQGPLCAEPTVGMAWTVEKIEYHRPAEAEDGECYEHGPRQGELARGLTIRPRSNDSSHRSPHLVHSGCLSSRYAGLVAPNQTCHVHVRHPSVNGRPG